MSYFTERHGLRNPIEFTETMTIEMYQMIFDCCEKYFKYIAFLYPEECPDGNGCCGLDYNKFSCAMKFEIPNLYRSEYGIISKPENSYYGTANYDQYALLDLIELLYDKMKDIKSEWWHSYHRHYDLSFAETQNIQNEFKGEINEIFKKTGLLYTLSSTNIVERVTQNGILSKEIENNVVQITEKGTKELINEAIILFKIPHPSARNDAVEKIWDALERLKTYYVDLDKKSSITKIVNDMSNGKPEFIELFNAEFKALTDIGNGFRIRHHETNKIDIADIKYYDYFFNRCLSLIALAIQYLQ